VYHTTQPQGSPFNQVLHLKLLTVTTNFKVTSNKYMQRTVPQYLVLDGDLVKPVQEEQQGWVDVVEPRGQGASLQAHVWLQSQDDVRHPSTVGNEGMGLFYGIMLNNCSVVKIYDK